VGKVWENRFDTPWKYWISAGSGGPVRVLPWQTNRIFILSLITSQSGAKPDIWDFSGFVYQMPGLPIESSGCCRKITLVRGKPIW